MRDLDWWKKNWCTKCGDETELKTLICIGTDNYDREKQLKFELCDKCIAEITNNYDLYKERLKFKTMRYKI